MPINPNALSSPDPDTEAGQTVAAAQDAEMSQQVDAVAPDGTELAQSGGAQEPAKRTRRNKAQMIADAVVPADADEVEVKDLNTGAKVKRAWLEAVQLVGLGAAEFVDKTLKYAVMKMEQQAAAPAFAQSDPQPAAAVGQQPSSPQAGGVPPGAALGDEVRVGAETYRVGHGGVLTSSPVADEAGNIVKAVRRWQRELGSGVDGPWESVALTQTETQRPLFDPPAQAAAGAFSEPAPNGKAEQDVVERAVAANAPVVQTEKLPHTIESVEGTQFVKIGTGILEKIGLPQIEQYAGGSSLQIGPITMSRTIVDDGRRTTHTFADGRTSEVITAAAEGFDLMDDTCEFIAARFRGQLQSFLQSIGALKQPVG